MNKEKLLEAFNSFNNHNILIIGDVMVDSYLWGKVERISPEAPVPIISVVKRENRLGGAANVALNIKALGAKAIIASVIGDDEKGKIFFELLKKRNLISDGIIESKDRLTTVKHRIISNGQHLLRVDQETELAINKNIEQQFIENIIKILEEKAIDAIIFEDYDKGIITSQVIENIIKAANIQNIPVLVDPKKNNFANYHGATLFKPNFKELNDGMKLEIKKGDYEELHKASQMLRDKMNIKSVLITLSELGIFISYNGKYHQIPTQVRDISDVSGAGDTVISVASLCLIAGLDYKNIALISNIAGGQVCEKVGVIPVNKEDLLNKCIDYLDCS
ncbi:MAG: hypothetical protein KAT68_14070 [Bacteroidales bacterium]|nr:hypothetical protein [Bacteroidales bacterium]